MNLNKWPNGREVMGSRELEWGAGICVELLWQYRTWLHYICKQIISNQRFHDGLPGDVVVLLTLEKSLMVLAENFSVVADVVVADVV